ncbi:hypothetical protein X798_03657 [Onchocerca flexuosa]|nr:hypothetical protein X798_03657 [Onchocerca flexuosa]
MIARRKECLLDFCERNHWIHIVTEIYEYRETICLMLLRPLPDSH